MNTIFSSRYAKPTLALAFALLLTSCAGGASVDTESTTAAETTETERLYPTVDKTYGGAVVHILSFDSSIGYSWQNLVNDIDVETLDGSILNDAVFKRNAKIENLLDIELVGVPVGHQTLSDDAYKDVASGDGYYDIIVPDMANSLTSLLTKQCLLDLKQLDRLNLDAPWWNSECTESLELFGKLYAAAGDMIYQDKLATIVCYYNKVLAEDFGLPELSEFALDGTWTLDKMVEYSRNIYADLNSNDTPDVSDRFGIISQNDFASFILNASGIPIVENGSTPKLNKSERFVNALERTYALMNDRELFYNSHVMHGDMNVTFAENRGLFLLRPTHSLFVLRSMQADFGILPMPKLDESQESYRSPMNTSVAVTVCIPKSCKDTDRASDIIELLCAESMYELIPALYEDVLGTKLVRDEVSSDILDIVYDNRFYDIGAIFNPGKWRDTIYESYERPIASLIAENESKVTAAIAELQRAVLEG